MLLFATLKVFLKTCLKLLENINIAELNLLCGTDFSSNPDLLFLMGVCYSSLFAATS